MKVLDLPDNQDNPIRQILLKQDDVILENLAKKSQEEIQAFIINENEIQKNDIKSLKISKNKQKDEQKKSLLNENKNETTKIITKETQEQKQNIVDTTENNKEKTFEDKKNDEKFNRLKSAFPQSILDKNPKIADMLREAEKS